MLLRSRFWLITISCILAATTLSAIALYSLNAALQIQKQKVIITMLTLSQGVLDHYHGLQVSGALSEADAQSQAEQALQLMHNSDVYFFVRNADHRMIVHPDSRVRGKITDGGPSPEHPGETVVRAYDEALQTASYGFAQAPTARVGSSRVLPKLNGVYRYQPWNWVVGTGVFTDDVENTIWKDMIALCSIAILALIMMFSDRSPKKGTEEAERASRKKAAGIEMRRVLAEKIRHMITANGWKAIEAGKLCGQSQARIHDLMQGNIARFSLETLVNMASLLGEHAQPPEQLSLACAPRQPD
jgi:predicted XRE-type DNA-binding protein